MIIRRATTDDAAALAALARETFVDAFGADNTAEDMAAYCEASFGEERQLVELADAGIVSLVAGCELLVAGEQLATSNQQLIAYAQLHRTPGSPFGEIELARFYVVRAHHGQGVAQALMESVVAEGRALGASTLWLGVWERNVRAITFYRKCGFAQCGSQPFLLGSDLQTDWVMARRL